MFFRVLWNGLKKPSYQIQPLFFDLPGPSQVEGVQQVSSNKQGENSGCQKKECKKLVTFCIGKAMPCDMMWQVHVIHSAKGPMLLEKLPQTLQQKHFHNPPWVRTYSQHEHFLCWLQKEQITINRLHWLKQAFFCGWRSKRKRASRNLMMFRHKFSVAF